MTTIAYRDGVLAADTGLFQGDIWQPDVSKVVANSQGELAASCGDRAYCVAFQRWFERGKPGAPPLCDRGLSIVVHADKSFTIYQAEGSYKPNTLYYALGAGFEVAYGALAAGTEATTAVQAAIQHHIHAQGRVESLSLVDASKLRSPRKWYHLDWLSYFFARLR